MKKFLYQRKTVGINLTPLIDVMFVIIIFFSLGTEIRKSGNVSIDLPTARSNDVSPIVEVLKISVDATGVMNVDGATTTIEQLESLLKSGKYDPQTPTVLEVDKNLPHGSVIRLLDTLKSNSFRRINFSTNLISE